MNRSSISRSRALSTSALRLLTIAGAVAATSNSLLAAAPPISSALTTVTVDGSPAASGGAASIVYDAGVYNMWYRSDFGDISGLHHATSTDGVNFNTIGPALS